MRTVNGKKTEILVKIVEDLSSIRDENLLIRSLLLNALDYTGAERGFLVRKAASGNLLYSDISGGIISAPEVSVSVIQQVLNTFQPVCLIENADGQSMPPTASIIALDLKSIMAVPMKLDIETNDGEWQTPDAVLYVDSQIVARPFDRQDLDFFSVLAQHAAAVWKNRLLIRRMEEDFKLLHEEVKSKFDYHKIIGQCEAMKKVYEILEILRPTDLDVLITGETGTGKELIAKAIHYASRRSDKPFKQINCAALPEGLVEVELFGVEKNVATEVKRRRGMIEQANEGTLFLDEIADMTPRIQNRILNFLETRRFRRIGGREEIVADVRILAATNKSLPEEIAKGRFRDALRYRLEVVPIHLPPLRDRDQDLRLLADFFLSEIVEQSGLVIHGFSNRAWERMQEYSWPGNVRELKHRIQSAAILARGSLIEWQDLGLSLPTDLTEMGSLKERRDALEKNLILRSLERHENRIQAAARDLGLGEATLRKKIKRISQ
ncbi:sigma-54-dependent Fis family transcriptional regulator [bacterium]|nr:sigma-54-dependent Fis family transcriptional regulator [candidate division CSSED10-310 bacterium]